MIAHTNTAAVVTTIREWKRTAEEQARIPQRNAIDRAHMEGRALAFGKVLEWLKESEKEA